MVIAKGRKILENLGLRVSFGRHINEMDDFDSTTIAHRIEDLHDAFRDPNVQLILCVRGGWNANQLLRSIDYDLIKCNPKILCGFSDITALATAIFAKTGLVTYCGPNFSTVCRPRQLEYTLDAFRKCLMGKQSFDVQPSKRWTDFGSPRTKPRANEGFWILHEGKAEGLLLGGNLCTLNLLQGTEFMPDFRGSILFLEDDYESAPHTFDRDLQSLLHACGSGNIRGFVIGRFQAKSNMTRSLLEQIIHLKKELEGIPIIANVDFGHSHPMITFPIGGRVSIAVKNRTATIEILEH